MSAGKQPVSVDSSVWAPFLPVENALREGVQDLKAVEAMANLLEVNLLAARAWQPGS